MRKERKTGRAERFISGYVFGFRAGKFGAVCIALVCTILALALTVLEGESAKSPVRADGIVLFGIAPSGVASFFQQTRCLVGRVVKVNHSSGKLTATITYPSGNYGLEGQRTTVLYSHHIQILESDHSEGKLDRIDLERYALIFVDTGRPGFVYRLVGLVAIPQNGKGLRWDYFADKPELWYRKKPESGR